MDDWTTEASHEQSLRSSCANEQLFEGRAGNCGADWRKSFLFDQSSMYKCVCVCELGILKSHEFLSRSSFYELYKQV